MLTFIAMADKKNLSELILVADLTQQITSEGLHQLYGSDRLGFEC